MLCDRRKQTKAISEGIREKITTDEDLRNFCDKHFVDTKQDFSERGAYLYIPSNHMKTFSKFLI